MNRITGTSSWLVTVVSVRMTPMCGFDRDGVFSFKQDQQGERDLALGKVSPERFSRRILVAKYIQTVVVNLIGRA